MRVSAVIITFNEQENIHAACESVAWADEILVVDSESTDRTRQIAEACGARVLINKWPGFAAQKQFATDSARHDWILSLDADERVSKELKNSLQTLRQREESSLADGYRVARRTFYLGRQVITRIHNQCLAILAPAGDSLAVADSRKRLRFAAFDWI